MQDPDIKGSAYRCGLEEGDILHAYRNAYKIRAAQGDHSLEMYIGAARNGVTILEIGVRRAGRQPVIIHAMPARQKFL